MLSPGNNGSSQDAEAYRSKRLEVIASGLVFPDGFPFRADRERIVARMIAVLEAVRAGIDLETGLFAANPVPLEAGLERIGQLVNELATR